MKAYHLLLFVSVALTSCSKRVQNHPFGELYQQRIDSVAATLDTLNYGLQVNDSCLLYVTNWIVEDIDCNESNFTISIYDASNDVVDSCRVFLNEWFGGFLKGPETVYYLSCGGSGRFCEVIEFDVINRKQGRRIFERSRVDEVELVDSVFNISCSIIWEKGWVQWTESYDIEGNLVYSRDSLYIDRDSVPL